MTKRPSQEEIDQANELAAQARARRAAIPPDQLRSFDRPDRFSGPPLGSDKDGNIVTEKPDDEPEQVADE
jgi:hypothetical protein